MSQNGNLTLFSKRILIAAVIFSAAIIAAVALTSAASDLLALGKVGLIYSKYRGSTRKL